MTRERSVLEKLSNLLGQTNVRPAREVDLIGQATTGVDRRVSAVAYPATHDQVVELVRLANREDIALYPVSTGNNWGYGSALPVTDDAVVVNLSRMDRVLDFDEELGLVKLEPGVTQAKLAAYLEHRGLEFLVPVTGAGPEASLIGNALERGYGLTPGTDHFGAVVRLRGVLGSGAPYEGPWGGAEGGDGFKWGIGPYLDGLFSQGNVGVVTSATIALARRPESSQAFVFEVEHDEALEATVAEVREVLRRVGALLGGINLMNRTRMLAMTLRNEKARGALSEHQVDEAAAAHGIAAWTGVGSLYGTARIARAARGEIRARLQRVARRVIFADKTTIRYARRVLSWAPSRTFVALRGKLERAEELVRVVEGRPSTVALPLARWRTPRPDHPGGLIWCAPLVPMRPSAARELTETVRRVTSDYGLDALVTMTTLSDRSFDCSIPLVFDGTSPTEAARARRCARVLHEELWSRGFFPYRVGTQDMSWLVGLWGQHASAVSAVKRALDPRGVIAPGRYGPAKTRKGAGENPVADLRSLYVGAGAD